MFAEFLPVVGRDDHQRILKRTPPFKRIEKQADVVIDVRDGALISTSQRSSFLEGVAAPALYITAPWLYRQELPIERCFRPVWAVRIVVIQECEERATARSHGPAQEGIIQPRGAFSAGDLILPPQPVIGRKSNPAKADAPYQGRQ